MTISRRPDPIDFALVHPCPSVPLNCKPCYKPYYKTQTFWVPERVLARIPAIFNCIA